MVVQIKPYYEILRGLREDHDLTQTTQQVYSRYENGVNEMPVRHIITLCKFYRVSADFILGLSAK